MNGTVQESTNGDLILAFLSQKKKQIDLKYKVKLLVLPIWWGHTSKKGFL